MLLKQRFETLKIRRRVEKICNNYSKWSINSKATSQRLNKKAGFFFVLFFCSSWKCSQKLWLVSPSLSTSPLSDLPPCLCAQRDPSRVKHLEEKLSAARRLLAQQKAQELSIQKEHRKADTHKKMTEFWDSQQQEEEGDGEDDEELLWPQMNCRLAGVPSLITLIFKPLLAFFISETICGGSVALGANSSPFLSHFQRLRCLFCFHVNGSQWQFII